MNIYRLYHREGAGRPPRVRWAFEEAGAPYEWVVMDDGTGHGAEHARRHPLGRVPVLESDDGLVYESAALCLHVADLNPAAGLISAPGTRRSPHSVRRSTAATTLRATDSRSPTSSRAACA